MHTHKTFGLIAAAAISMLTAAPSQSRAAIITTTFTGTVLAPSPNYQSVDIYGLFGPPQSLAGLSFTQTITQDDSAPNNLHSVQSHSTGLLTQGPDGADLVELTIGGSTFSSATGYSREVNYTRNALPHSTEISVLTAGLLDSGSTTYLFELFSFIHLRDVVDKDYHQGLSSSDIYGGVNGGFLSYGIWGHPGPIEYLILQYSSVTVSSVGEIAPPPVLGVPEPSSWALAIVGFFGSGLALREGSRRRPSGYRVR